MTLGAHLRGLAIRGDNVALMRRLMPACGGCGAMDDWSISAVHGWPSMGCREGCETTYREQLAALVATTGRAELWADYRIGGKTRRRWQREPGGRISWERAPRGLPQPRYAEALLWHAPECPDASACEIVLATGEMAAAAMVSAESCAATVVSARHADYEPLRGRTVTLWGGARWAGAP